MMMSQDSQKLNFKVPIKLLWRRGFEEITWKQASTSWVYGMRFAGKSNLVEIIGLKYLLSAMRRTYKNTLFDIFSARDSESLGWVRSPWNDVLLVVGNSVSLHTNLKWIRMEDFALKEAEEHEVVITVPRFFSTEYEMFATLSSLVDILKWRVGFDPRSIDCLLIREAGQLLASRLVSGAARNIQEAEYDFIDMHNQAYHVGLATVIDSLRPISIAPAVRELANYTFMKRMGKMKIPRELYYILKRVDPYWLRRMRDDEFLLHTDKDNYAAGTNPLLPWHIQRGEDIVKGLGIQIEPNIAKAKELETKDSTPKREHKVTPEYHKEIITLKEEGKSYRAIIDLLQGKVHLSLQNISIETHNHHRQVCSCYV